MTPLTEGQTSTLLRDMGRWHLSSPGEASVAAFERIKLTVQSLIAQAEAAAVERCAVIVDHYGANSLVARDCAATIRSLTNQNERTT